MHIEDFDPEIDSKFIEEALKPYFKDVFQDLSLRSQSNA